MNTPPYPTPPSGPLMQMLQTLAGHESARVGTDGKVRAGPLNAQLSGGAADWLKLVQMGYVCGDPSTSCLIVSQYGDALLGRTRARQTPEDLPAEIGRR